MKNKKQFLSIPELVMTVTLIVMGSAFLGVISYFAAKYPSCSYTPVLNPARDISEKYDLKKIEDWGIYTDGKYNFEITYPKNMLPVTNYKENVTEKEVQQTTTFNVGKNIKIIISIWNASAAREEKSPDEEYNEIYINNLYGWQSKIKDEKNVSNEKNKNYYFATYLYSQDHIYQIEYKGVYDIDGIDLYNKMVATFKTNQEMPK